MKQTQDYEDWPLPIFRLNQDLMILESSRQARIMFSESPVFTGLLDEESRQKAVEFLNPERPAAQIELNFLSAEGELLLMDVHCNWKKGEIANVIAVPKDRHFNRVAEQLAHLRKRLHETNYDLLLEKERSDELLQNVRELSAPCIQLDKRRLLIPLFGNIDQQKMDIIVPRILDNVYRHDAETVIFELTAMDDICQSGLNQLHALFQSLSVMGITVSITGVHPRHAKRLHELDITIHADFSTSLHDVLSKTSAQ
jgi:rsbT co-antagonist protein RsbR